MCLSLALPSDVLIKYNVCRFRHATYSAYSTVAFIPPFTIGKQAKLINLVVHIIILRTLVLLFLAGTSLHESAAPHHDYTNWLDTSLASSSNQYINIHNLTLSASIYASVTAYCALLLLPISCYQNRRTDHFFQCRFKIRIRSTVIVF